jgi:hypothetical protein
VALGADGTEKNLPALCLNGGPDRDTMRPIICPAGLVHYRRPAISFLASPARPACLRRAAIPRPVTASGPPAHRFIGARRTLVAAADSSLRTRLRPLLAALLCPSGRAEGRARPRAPLREPLALLSEASAELARPQRPERTAFLRKQ